MMVGEGAVAVVRGEWLPCRVESALTSEEMDMAGPSLDEKGGKSRGPAKGEATGGCRGAGNGKADDEPEGPEVGEGGGMVRDANEGGGGGGGSRGPVGAPC